MEPRLKAFRCGTARQRSACCVDTTQPTAVRRNIPQRAVYITFTTRKTTRGAATQCTASGVNESVDSSGSRQFYTLNHKNVTFYF